MNFDSKNLMERHFKYSYTHAQKVKEIDKELQVGHLSPRSKREREVVELVQRFLSRVKTKRTGVYVAPKSLTMGERSSSDSAAFIKDLARKRWSYAMHTVLKRNQVHLMTLKWDQMDSKILAVGGYLQPVLYFTGSRLFLRGTVRTFVDIKVYLHATVHDPIKRVKSVLEILSSTVK